MPTHPPPRLQFVPGLSRMHPRNDCPWSPCLLNFCSSLKMVISLPGYHSASVLRSEEGFANDHYRISQYKIMHRVGNCGGSCTHFGDSSGIILRISALRASEAAPCPVFRPQPLLRIFFYVVGLGTDGRHNTGGEITITPASASDPL